MIRLFRKIRQQLLAENKLQQYLLYALGEIFLVVLGILIALQINNWNEDRKSVQQGEEMILEIKAGLAGDLRELDGMIHFQDIVMNSQTVLSDWMGSDRAFDDSLSSHVSRTYMTRDYAVNYSGYETLKQFGLHQIDNDSIRLSIANLYEIQYPRFIKYVDIYQRFLEELFQNNATHFNELNYMRPSMKPLDAARWKRDEKYFYDLNTLRNFNQLLVFQAGILRDEIAETYQIIDRK